MGITDIVSGIFKPASDLVTKLVTTDKERGEIQLELVKAQISVAQGYLEYDAKIADAQKQVIVAEAQGASWMQRNWRPLLMLMFGFIIGWNFIGVDVLTWGFTIFAKGTPPPPRLEIPGGMWTLLQLGIGGYIAGRSGEKIAQTVAGKGITFGKGKNAVVTAGAPDSD